MAATATDVWGRKALRTHAEGVRGDYEALLKAFVEMPGVSMDPERTGDVVATAKLARDTFREFGFACRLLPTEGTPMVHAHSKKIPGAPTVTVYNHLDVQPGWGEHEGTGDPFAFTPDPTKDGRWFGRGTTDDKGPGLAALFGARYALDHGARVNVHFLWETEEEIGSPNFEKAVRREKQRLATDVVVVSDTVWVSRTKPACPAGLRGLQAYLFRLQTGKTDEHSGTTGGAARNPISEMVKVLAACVDGDTGRIKIPGFSDDVRALTPAERRDFRSSGFTIAQFKRDHNFKSVRARDAMDAMVRAWAKPTFEIHGIRGGHMGDGVKTIVPHYAEAKVSTRLVPDQDPRKQFRLVRDFVKSVNPDVKVSAEGSLAPHVSAIDGPWNDAVRSAMKFGFGKEPVFIREGGSIGAVPTMEKVLGCPVVFLGLSLPEHGYHAPNENFDWGQAAGGIASFAHLFRGA